MGQLILGVSVGHVLLGSSVGHLLLRISGGHFVTQVIKGKTRWFCVADARGVHGMTTTVVL